MQGESFNTGIWIGDLFSLLFSSSFFTTKKKVSTQCPDRNSTILAVFPLASDKHQLIFPHCSLEHTTHESFQTEQPKAFSDPSTKVVEHSGVLIQVLNSRKGNN